MHNEIIKSRIEDDLNKRVSPPPQGVAASNFGLRNITEGNQCIESSPILKRVPWPHVLGVMFIDEIVQEYIEIEENFEEQETILQEGLMLLGLRIPHFFHY